MYGNDEICEKNDGNQWGKIIALKWIKPEESGK
jgi:hypothetical protein